MGTSAHSFSWQCPKCFVINSLEGLHLSGVRCGNCLEYTFRDYPTSQDNSDTFGFKNYVRNCVSYESLPTNSNVFGDVSSSAFSRRSRSSIHSLSGFLPNFENNCLAYLKSVSLQLINREWICAQCSFKYSRSLSCLICGKDKMAMPQIFVNDDEMQEKQSNINALLDNNCQDCPVNKSPKRHSLSVYERVKYKVSRSLSNGSTIHKKYTEPRRPSSLLVDKSNIDFNSTDKNQNFNSVVRHGSETWSCQRCTLDNSVELERCDMCETPKKSYIPLSTSDPSETSMVISVPKWEKTMDTHKKKSGTNINPQSEQWQKSVYKRCQSEYLENDVNSHDISEKIRMGESNILRSSANNLNLQLSSVSNRKSFTSYSYIGISDPNNKTSPFLTSQEILGSQNTSTGFNSSSTFKNTLDFSQLHSSLDRMWTCIKCSYSYNYLWCDTCEICKSVRTPPSLTKPSLITVTKDSSNFLVPKPDTNDSLHGLHLEDFQVLPLNIDTADVKWTCRKCTLVNLGSDVACIACGGSKLKSTSVINDLTLRKGEFWTCQHCTLKNPLNVQICQVCKNQNKLSLSMPLKTASPRSPSHKHGKQKLLQAVGGAIPKQKAVVRRNSAGCATNRSLHKQKVTLFTDFKTSEHTEIQSELKWQCIHCTFENPIKLFSCEMCQRARCNSSKITSASQCLNMSSQQNKSISKSKQESELMEDLRFVEEKEAINEWDRIIKYCSEVNIFYIKYILHCATFYYKNSYVRNSLNQSTAHTCTSKNLS